MSTKNHICSCSGRFPVQLHIGVQHTVPPEASESRMSSDPDAVLGQLLPREGAALTAGPCDMEVAVFTHWALTVCTHCEVEARTEVA